MNLDTRYHIQAERKKDWIKKREQDPDWENTYGYKPREAVSRGINAEESKFKSIMDNGLNRAESVFDKTAIFRTN